MDDEAEETRRGQGLPCCCILLKWVVFLRLTVWQYNVLEEYSNVMPSSIWDGNHVPMSDECARIYFVLQRSLLSTFLLFVLSSGTCVYICFFAILIRQSSPLVSLFGQMFFVLGYCVYGCSYCALQVFWIVVSIQGISAIRAAGRAEVSDCESLYRCGYYVFIYGFPFFLAFMCLECCCGTPLGPMPQMMSPEELPDHYAALEVPPDADYDTIKEAFFRGSRRYHPDKNPNADQRQKEINETKQKEINAAWAVLRDKDKRAAYDAQMRAKPLLSRV